MCLNLAKLFTKIKFSHYHFRSINAIISTNNKVILCQLGLTHHYWWFQKFSNSITVKYNSQKQIGIDIDRGNDKKWRPILNRQNIQIYRLPIIMWYTHFIFNNTNARSLVITLPFRKQRQTRRFSDLRDVALHNPHCFYDITNNFKSEGWWYHRAFYQRHGS